MSNNKQELVNKQIRSVTYLGAVINISLSIIKVIVGLLADSLALIADGIHSISDLVTDVAVLIGLQLGARKPDKEHPYGHGRLETFSGVVISIILIVIGCAMIYFATISIAKNETTKANPLILIVALISVVAKEALYQITKKVAVTGHSTALYANAWHHRSDALSSVAVVVGFVTLAIGFEHGDQVAAMAVGLMIALVGVSTIGNAVRELSEGAVDSKTVELIEKVIDAEPSIKQWHRLRTRMVGREIFLDVHILVDPELNVTEAHKISDQVEKAIDESISRPVNITIHIEPDLPMLRR